MKNRFMQCNYCSYKGEFIEKTYDAVCPNCRRCISKDLMAFPDMNGGYEDVSVKGETTDYKSDSEK